MDIVIDTSAIIAVIANEPEKPSLIRLTSGADLIAPASVHLEIGIRPEQPTGSPLDIEGIDLDVTTDEIVQSIAEGRRYSS